MFNADKRVVVTGLGALTPIGLTPEEFWKNLIAGVSGAALIKSFDTSKVETKFGCELKGYDAINYLDKKAARRLDLFSQYSFAAAKMALKDAGIDAANLSEDEKERIGVVVGSGIGGIQTFYQQALINQSQGPHRVSPFFIPMLIPDIACGHISIEYGFKGPNHCLVSACATCK